MKKIILVAVFWVVLGLLSLANTGCCCKNTGQPGETAEEVARRHQRIRNIQCQEMRSDWDAFWLIDRPSRLSSTVRVP